MAHIDTVDLYNPFGWRLAEAADPATSDERRQRLHVELLLCEAAELALGYRHLTIRHGDPSDLTAARHLSAFYDRIAAFAVGCPDTRVRGDAEFVTVTIRSDDADQRLTALRAMVDAADPGDWLVVESVIPPPP